MHYKDYYYNYTVGHRNSTRQAIMANSTRQANMADNLNTAIKQYGQLTAT